VQLLSAVPTSYSPALVLLSVLIACTAAYAALSLTARLSLLHHRAWRNWWGLGTLILGLGIWAMHFVGMLALHLGMPMTYRFWPTVLSVLPALLASGLVLQVASRPQLPMTALLVSSAVMGSGIAGMHYLGMTAVAGPLKLTFSAVPVVLSVMIAVAASGAALFLAFSLKKPSTTGAGQPAGRAWPVRQLPASLFLGLGIASMHYTGMWATTFTAPAMTMPMGAETSQSILAITVGVAIFALFGLLATALAIEWQFTRQQRQRDRLEQLVQARTAELGNALERNQELYRTSVQTAERWHRILNTLTEGVTQLDRAGTVLACNTSAAKLLDLEVKDILGRRLLDLQLCLEDEHGREVSQELLLQRLLAQPGAVQTVVRQRPTGTRQWLSVARHELYLDTPEDGAEHLVVCMADVTEQRENERHLQRQAHTDALTGLANRHTLYEQLPELVYNATWTRTSVAVLFVDLDQFKAINDSLGHDAGDQVLQEVARRLQRLVRETDSVARIGGDEFVILLSEVHAPTYANVERVMQHVLQALSQPFEVAGTQCTLGASIGGVIGHGHSTAKRLLMRADQLMYRAKSQGRGGYVIEDEDDKASEETPVTPV